MEILSRAGLPPDRAQQAESQRRGFGSETGAGPRFQEVRTGQERALLPKSEALLGQHPGPESFAEADVEAWVSLCPKRKSSRGLGPLDKKGLFWLVIGSFTLELVSVAAAFNPHGRE